LLGRETLDGREVDGFGVGRRLELRVEVVKALAGRALVPVLESPEHGGRVVERGKVAVLLAGGDPALDCPDVLAVEFHVFGLRLGELRSPSLRFFSGLKFISAIMPMMRLAAAQPRPNVNE
jgi:hypothetical protein